MVGVLGQYVHQRCTLARCLLSDLRFQIDHEILSGVSTLFCLQPGWNVFGLLIVSTDGGSIGMAMFSPTESSFSLLDSVH